ncbi:MAG TPA: hypothetical protein VGS16_00940 [Candidatus Dormibacteraeota bacterium]|nr:hypothetical protein [Candidatus Dormibacteraeota bacterium]
MGSFRYHNTLHGTVARGCHHRGDGPDASQHVISNNRQRLGVLVIEGSRRNLWGQWTLGPYHLEKEVSTMAAKKKAAKKPAAKKAAKKSAKKK